jgi:Outer membrane protein beta-barrel domain
MDKQLHNDIGEQFRDEINSLSQQPRAHIWEQVDKALDKTEVTTYKEKFLRLRKRTLLLLLLLIGISTFSVIFFNQSKNKNNQQSFNKQQDGRVIADKSLPVYPPVKSKNNLPLSSSQQQAKEGNTAFLLPGVYTEPEFSYHEPLPFPQKNNIAEKTKNAHTTGENLMNENMLSIIENNIIAPVMINDIPETNPGTKNTGNVLSGIFQPEKKDTLQQIATTVTPISKTPKRVKLPSKFTLTAFAAPDYSAYRLQNDQLNNYDSKDGIATRERSDLSFSAGLLLGYQVGDKITLQSGIIYSASDISITPSKIYAEKNSRGEIKFRYNTSSGYGYVLPSFSRSPVVGDSLYADGANHTLRYISIPVIVKYQFGSKKITFHPGIGATFNLLTKATLTTDLVDQLQRETEYVSKLEGMKKNSYSIMLTPEVQYRLSKKWSISLLPYFKFAPASINKGNVVKSYPYTYGLGIGTIRKF